MWNSKSNLVFNWYLFIVNIVIPYTAIFFFYSRIFVFAHKSKNKSKSSSVNRSIRLAKTFFASFMLFTSSWMPYGLSVLIDYENRFPRNLVRFSIAFALLNSSFNPIIYSVFNSNFRKSCGNLFKKICCCASFFNLRNNQISASGNQSSTTNNTSKQVKIQTRALYNT